jgi:hypothetical protein
LAEFKNPQQEPGTERRLLIVFVLTFVVLIIFQTFVKKPQPPAAQPAQNQPAQTALAQTAPVRPVPPTPAPSATITKQASAET